MLHNMLVGCVGTILCLVLCGRRPLAPFLTVTRTILISSPRIGVHVTITALDSAWDATTVGREMYDLIRELYPLCRSITGNGLRESLKILQRHIPLSLHEVPSGTRVFDWVIPKEWNIRDAYIKNAAGERVVDFQQHNLHVVNYSIPVQQNMTR